MNYLRVDRRKSYENMLGSKSDEQIHIIDKRFRDAIVDIQTYQISALTFYLGNIQTDKYSDALKLF